MKKNRFYIPILGLLLQACCGCSHYIHSTAADRSTREQILGDLAVAGILDRRGVTDSPARFSENATELLLDCLDPDESSDWSGKLKSEQIALLLSSPGALSIQQKDLRQLRKLIRHRYVLVGEQGACPALHQNFWDIFILIPTPVIVVGFTVPVQISKEDGIVHATRTLRVVDLESAAVVCETHEVLRESPEESEFSSGQIASAIDSMNLAE